MITKNLNSRGFTLVELIVVIAMLAVLLGVFFVMLDPLTQLRKARDAQRKQDFEQIRNALDTYYNDNSCYPKSGEIPFGFEWTVGNSVYMKKVPQDPTPKWFSGTRYDYAYQTDGSNCPQWAILYAHLEIILSFTSPEHCVNKIIRTMCPKPTYSVSVDKNYSYCLPIGQISCQALHDLGTSGMAKGYTPTLPPQPTSSLPPSAIPQDPSDCRPPKKYFAVSAGLCNEVSSDKCTLYGGPLICYSEPAGADVTKCNGVLCTQ
jgi:prepilin-type N-terminal cleavage/methylation domain-containing protein